MPQTKSHGKSADRKRAEIRELEIQMAKRFLCGTCHLGFDTQEEFEAHNETEEHNYHITRKIGTLVPGLAFCAACSCLVQTLYGWQSHVMTDKHQRVKQSLKLCGIDGEFDEPLGCSSPGQIGLPISPSEIDMKRASSYGYGHGGKMGAGIPIIGLDMIQSLLSRGQEVKHKNLMEKFMCRVCMETFTFELRGNHLGSVEHWLNYLRRNYPAWHKAVMEIPPEYVIQIKFRLMFYAHKIEEREKLSESVAAQALRERFSIQATQRKDHNIGKDRNERGHYPKPKPGQMVFVKEGEKDVAKYVVGTAGPPTNKKKKKNGRGGDKRNSGKSNWDSKKKAGNQNRNGNKFIGHNNATPSSEIKTPDPIVTVERPGPSSKAEISRAESSKAVHTNIRKPVNLMAPSNAEIGESKSDSNSAKAEESQSSTSMGAPDTNDVGDQDQSGTSRGAPEKNDRGVPRGASRGASRGAPKTNNRGGQRGGSTNRGSKPRGGSKNAGPPQGYLAEDYWEPDYYDSGGYYEQEYYSHQYEDGNGGWGEDPYYSYGEAEGYDYSYSNDPYYSGDAGYAQQDSHYYNEEYGQGYQEYPPSKRQRPQEYYEEYYEQERAAAPAPPHYPRRGTDPYRSRGHVRLPRAHRGTVMRGRGARRPY